MVLWWMCTFLTRSLKQRNVGISFDSFKGNVGNYSNSFASVLKSGKPVGEATGREVPSLVLDDTCFSDRDFNLSLMGKVKDITVLPNLYVILEEEGSWFSSLQLDSNYFVSDERIIFKVIIQGNVHWVRAKEMEGWDPLLRNEDYASSSSDEENEQENEGLRNGEKYESDKEVDKSEDPFNIYDLLNKNKNKESDGNSKEGELKYPPGFTPKETSVNDVPEKEIEAPSEEVKQNSYNSVRNNYLNVSYCSQSFKAGGSIIDLMDELVKDGECVIMGDFKEVCSEHERYGSVFNVQSAAAFNNFISLVSLIDLPIDGYAYTWVHKFVTKMSKLGRFLISNGLMASFPHLSAICLDKHLSDHRPILMREMNIDYGPTLFRFFHSWFQIEGFDKLVEDTWMHIDITDSNGMILLKKKLQALKIIIREWTKNAKKCSYKKKSSIQSKLFDIDKIIDQGGSNEVILNDRSILLKELHDIISMDLEEMA
uniref:RNA-directed DNA polymerase, eukaryota n=1 Tax=Tanacetum cinerariifolium TaxID=118510 RepID=A0A6L2L087_TANCI|nr:RNA-directed DNA polymerase, eukaryota [Tanacetum cinerariifolium]